MVIELRIPDITIDGQVWTHDDWETDTTKVLSELAAALASTLVAQPSGLAGRLKPRLYGDVKNIRPMTADGRRTHAPFPARALRSETGVAPFLDFPD